MNNVKKRTHLKMVGKNNPRWNGGIATYKNSYQLKLNRLEKLKQTNYKCEVCNKHTNEIHHEDGSKDNHNISNLMTLCHKHHMEKHLGRKNNPKKISPYIKKYGMFAEEIAYKTGYSLAIVYKRLSGIPPKRCGVTKEQILKNLQITL